jgi:hypothetical protein
VSAYGSVAGRLVQPWDQRTAEGLGWARIRTFARPLVQPPDQRTAGSPESAGIGGFARPLVQPRDQPPAERLGFSGPDQRGPEGHHS